MSSKSFPDEVVQKALLWCNRHCCVCGKQCGVNIETHHIDPKGKADQDNCLPVCFVCHAALEHYSDAHPRGRKFRIEELKQRREQVYECQTRHLVPPTRFVISHDPRGLPYARFKAMNLGSYPPVKARLKLTTFVDGKNLGVVQRVHYDGSIPVNLNPQQGFNGWFVVPEEAVAYQRRLLVRVDVVIIDPYEREHPLLPFGFVHLRADGKEPEGWYYEPSPEADEVLNPADGDAPVTPGPKAREEARERGRGKRRPARKKPRAGVAGGG